MKTPFLLTLFCLAFIACAQNPQKMNTPLISELYKEVKYQDKAVQYHAGIEIGGCAFSFLVNDVPVVQYFEDGNGTLNTSAPLNDQILKSGTQTWKLTLYPGYQNGKQTDALSPGIESNVTIETLQFYEGGVKDLAPKFSLLETPKRIDDKDALVYQEAGKKMMVYSGTFQAKVPYELAGWSAGADLRKEDMEKLQREVLAAFKEYGSLLQEGNLQKLSAVVYNKEKEIAQAYFLSEAEMKDRVNKYATGLKNPTLKIQPLKDYQLKIYGDGRLVTLERTDFPYIGEPALQAFYKDDAGEDYEKSYTVYFYRPSPSAKLEIIR